MDIAFVRGGTFVFIPLGEALGGGLLSLVGQKSVPLSQIMPTSSSDYTSYACTIQCASILVAPFQASDAVVNLSRVSYSRVGWTLL